MGRVCREVHEWIEEQIEQPIEAWEERQEERCREEECNWWQLCLNVLFCWLALTIVKVIRIVLVTVGKWVIRINCEFVSFVVDVAAFLVGLALSIPILGGIFRTVLNFLMEVVWRAGSVFDLASGLLGLRIRKKMYFGLVIAAHDGIPITTQAAIQPQIDAAIEHYNRLCNINLIFTGTCNTSIPPPGDPFTYVCNAEGFFRDWWIDGSFYQLASDTCKFEDGWKRVVGYGAEIIVFVVDDVLPDPSDGCGMTFSVNYILTEAGTADNIIAHEIGHACWLYHHTGDTNNLMSPNVLSVPQTLTNWQVSVIRSSRHCVYV
ncbi:MAG: hypothetical protein J7621_12885 [Niastella sp.]|nr:hypothetical protein [Niastella sp.]